MSIWSTHVGLEKNMRSFGLASDEYSRAISVIEQQHKLAHDGMFFVTSGKDTGWLNAGVKRFLISTPALTFPHIQVMKLQFGRGDIDFVAYEGATTSDDGTALTVQNVNRNSSNTPNTDLFAEPTVTDNGTQLFTLWVPPTSTGNGQSADGVSAVGQASEWILQPSTKYLILMTNNSGDTIDWSYEFSFYELSYDDSEDHPQY